MDIVSIRTIRRVILWDHLTNPQFPTRNRVTNILTARIGYDDFQIPGSLPPVTREPRFDGNTTDEDELSEDHVRQHHYRIMSDPAMTSEEKYQRLLKLGVNQLGVENGHVVKIDQQANRHEVIAASGSDIVQTGDVTHLEKTYCRKTITTDSILSIYDAHKQGWDDDPAVTMWNITCYIGTKMFVGNNLYGTVCFVDNGPGDTPFTPEEESFVDLLSSSISRLLERQHHDQTLQREQEWFQLFVEEVTDYAVFMLDPAGHVLSWNKGAEQIKGYTEDEIIGEHFARFYPEDDRTLGHPEQLLKEAQRTGQVEDEGWRIRKDGSQFWALVSITALYDDEESLRGFGKVTRDLTKRRNAQQALEAEQAFIDQALDTLDDVFYVLTPEREIDRVNQRLIDVTGYSEDEILSMNPVDFFAQEDQEKVGEALVEVLETGESNVEATLLTKNKERRQYEFRQRWLTDDDGSVTGIVGIGRDVTERTLYEERLEVAQRVLRHNLRNDLMIIRGWVEMLVETSTDTQQQAVERVLTTIDRLTNISEKTRLMAQLDSSPTGSHPLFDLSTRLPAIIEEFRSTYSEATIELELSSTDTLLVPTDERAETAITNAIENAIEHNPSDDPWVGIVVKEENGQVQIHIQDNGHGIPEMEQAVIEKGEETPLEHGTGLGLWLIYWCVTTAGGTVSFDEREPRGSTITLIFPLASDT